MICDSIYLIKKKLLSLAWLNATLNIKWNKCHLDTLTCLSVLTCERNSWCSLLGRGIHVMNIKALGVTEPNNTGKLSYRDIRTQLVFFIFETSHSSKPVISPIWFQSYYSPLSLTLVTFYSLRSLWAEVNHSVHWTVPEAVKRTLLIGDLSDKLTLPCWPELSSTHFTKAFTPFLSSGHFKLTFSLSSWFTTFFPAASPKCRKSPQMSNNF